MRRLSLILAVGATCAGGASGAAADPIVEKPTPNQIPEFVGRAATPQPLSLVDAPTPPRHPFMAPNGRSNLHDDAYMTDTTNWPGPARARHAAPVLLQRRRLRLGHVRPRGPDRHDLRGRDGAAALAARPAHARRSWRAWTCRRRQPGPRNPFTDFSGGGYFYLDHRDRAVIPTTTRHIWVVGETRPLGRLRARARLRPERRRSPSDDKIISALPDWSGRIWFASSKGVVGHDRPGQRRGRSRSTRGEQIGNSFAVDETGGVYIVTDAALYRFDADAAGAPAVTWREAYPNTGESEAGPDGGRAPARRRR